MGRYYSGDIGGKFWFAVQSSDDASFFGGEEIEPNHIEYYFDESHRQAIDGGIAQCVAALGEYRKQLDEHFRANGWYTDEQLMGALGVAKDKMQELLMWYARLELGLKIQKCVAEKGSCSFEAEF